MEAMAVRRQRLRLVAQLERLLDAPATYLAFVFAGILVVELVITAQRGDVPPILGTIQLAIWGFFLVHFLLGLLIAPTRLSYLRRHWLTALSLLIPFLRVIRVLRAVAVLRAVRLVRLVTTFNRSARAIRSTLAWNGAGYAMGLAASVALLGSAGIFVFESEAADASIGTYAEALWWTAATLTTVGAASEPVTLGGRIVGLGVMLTGLIVLGYVAGLVGALLFARREQRTRPVARG